jgi:hypothetical protein
MMYDENCLTAAVSIVTSPYPPTVDDRGCVILVPNGRGETDRTEMALSDRNFGECQSNSRLSPAARRALAKLAGTPEGSTDNLLLAHGFKRRLIAGSVDAGLATAKTEVMSVGERAVHVMRIMITNAGRVALERSRNVVDA